MEYYGVLCRYVLKSTSREAQNIRDCTRHYMPIITPIDQQHKDITAVFWEPGCSQEFFQGTTLVIAVKAFDMLAYLNACLRAQAPS